MTGLIIALIASVPGLLLGIAALVKANRPVPGVEELTGRLDRQRKDLDDANEKIRLLTERMDECAKERMQLMRENLDLWHRLDGKAA